MSIPPDKIYYALQTPITAWEEEQLTRIFTEAGYVVTCGLVVSTFGLEADFKIKGALDLSLNPSFDLDICDLLRSLQSLKILPTGAGFLEFLTDLKLPKISIDLNGIKIGLTICDEQLLRTYCLPDVISEDCFDTVRQNILDNNDNSPYAEDYILFSESYIQKTFKQLQEAGLV